MAGGSLTQIHARCSVVNYARFQSWREEQQASPAAVKDQARFAWTGLGAPGFRFSLHESGQDDYLPHQASRAAFEVAFITFMHPVLRRCAKKWVKSGDVFCETGADHELVAASADTATFLFRKTPRAGEDWEEKAFRYEVIRSYGSFVLDQIILPSREYLAFHKRHPSVTVIRKSHLLEVWVGFVTGR